MYFIMSTNNTKGNRDSPRQNLRFLLSIQYIGRNLTLVQVFITGPHRKAVHPQFMSETKLAILHNI
jgi:hypothetical protein